MVGFVAVELPVDGIRATETLRLRQQRGGALESPLWSRLRFRQPELAHIDAVLTERVCRALVLAR